MFFVKAARGKVGVADFEEDGCGAASASECEKFVEQLRAEAATLSGRGDDDIFELAFIVDDASDEEAEPLRIFFRDERDTGGIGQRALVEFARPVGGGGRGLAERDQGGQVSGSGRANGHRSFNRSKTPGLADARRLCPAFHAKSI